MCRHSFRSRHHLLLGLGRVIKSIQGKGINPDIIIEQGEFESYEYRSYSESDLKESLDKEEEKDNSIVQIDKNFKNMFLPLKP